MRRIVVLILISFCCLTKAHAWGGRGHELVAYIAYMNLTPEIRAKVDALVQQNPCIAEWRTYVKAMPAAQQPVALFMLAATWPDRIKLAAPLSKTPYDCPGHPDFLKNDGGVGPGGHFSVDIPPTGPEASQNIGYTDNRRHQYWHFIDTPLSGDGTATQPAPSPNVLTEVILLSRALGSTEAIGVRSFDMVWLEHLMGDIHQPLHVTQRFTKTFPNGDGGWKFGHDLQCSARLPCGAACLLGWPSGER
ncbi:S1/P1 nuclease [Granulicella arctica]|uniref:S1/P1 nuclease n=1 Tax=Granulicella arctica TaxID=940613 RepID=UPI0021DF757C|nr:S1/P1 nuclease [Granulicella arctica]